ncbi:MAG: M1 family metallopeptidase [Aureispira sp.]
MHFLKLFGTFLGILNAFLLITSSIQAQENNYFQQQVNYDIQVELDDKEHYLRGQIEMAYYNNSPDTLTAIYFHVWPNGYKNKQTAFAKQLLNQGRLDFHFSQIEERGFLDSLNFTCDGSTATWEEKEGQIDVLRLTLPKVLAPQDSVTIRTPFRVKLPGNFSRLAHREQAYMLCQWYPKPAVYDQTGWHTMSYLDYGEFYSEFGNYKVQITLPSNYVVGATGQLETESEYAFLQQRAKETAEQRFSYRNSFAQGFPVSSSEQKTLTYTAQKVHDFAWFADKRYWVELDTFQLASGRSIESCILYTSEEADLWQKKAERYTQRAVRFYSDIVGEYPYDNVTVAQGIYKGADMEYPTITVIGRAGYSKGLDNVITHEVGHNWFYGILGSNERVHPWMDEGLNTYLDSRHSSMHYNTETNWEYLSYIEAASQHQDQPIERPSDSITSSNYYLCGYGKPTLAFRYLQQYLGTAEMDKLLQQYFEQWKFKHPQPKDLRAVFEANSSKDVAWFFDHIIDDNAHLDYATTRYQCCQAHDKASITIKNTGDFAAPIPVAVLDNQGDVVEEVWVENLPIGKDTTLQLSEGLEYRIDYAKELPEINRNNNVVRSYGLFKKGEPLQLKFGGEAREPQQPRINFLPLVGYNLYDGAQIGGIVYNLPLPERRWDYTLASFFTTNSLTWTGFGQIKHQSYIKNHRFSQGLRFKSFHKRHKKPTIDRRYKFSERYTKITPYLRLDLGKRKDTSLEEQSIELSAAFIIEERGIETRDNSTITTSFNYEGKEMTWRPTIRLTHWYNNKNVLSPLSLQTELEYASYETPFRQEQYLKLSTELKVRFLYGSDWGVDLRAFAGGFLWHTNRDFGAFPLVLISGNRKDYHYDESLLGRREQENIAAQQVALRDGGFKTAIEEIQFAGASNTFIIAVNLKADIPIRLPLRLSWLRLKPFLDIGYHQITDPVIQVRDISTAFMASAGLMLDIGNGLGGIYVPLLATENLQQKANSFAGNAFYRRITFSVNLNHWSKKKLVEMLFY